MITKSPQFSIAQITPRKKFCSLVIALISFWLASCTTPVATLEKQAFNEGLIRKVLPTSPIPIVTYATPISEPTSYRYIYLEGDGRPWDKGLWPASDPNTRNSVVLPLLLNSPQGGIYLSRPCYGWKKMPDHCVNTWWTGGRYSSDVVKHLSQALDMLKQTHSPDTQWILVGHSGGGTLAMLLASKRNDVVGVVTLAGNLDHKAWTTHFGYLPLQHSLNPAELPALPDTIKRWHLIAENDSVIPPAIIKTAAQRDSKAIVIAFSEFDHQCCWKRIWPEFVGNITNELDAH